MSVIDPSRTLCSDCGVWAVAAGLGVTVQPLWREENHDTEKGAGRRCALQVS